MGHDGVSGLLKTSGAATAEAECGRGGRLGACGFTTAGTLMLNLRRRKRFRKARLNCSIVSDGDAGDIVRQTVNTLDLETTINTNMLQALCHSGGALAQGRVQNRAHRDFVKRKQKKKIEEGWWMVKSNS
jgi:hypothetical protein